MRGTIVNVIAVVAGSLLGVFLKGRFPEKVKEIIMQGLGLASCLIGIQMALESKNILIVIFSLVIGGICGELIGIEKKLNGAGAYIQRKLAREDDLFIQGFDRCNKGNCFMQQLV